MGYELYREVMYGAPENLDTGELALLLVLADLANEQTRRCAPGMAELGRLMRMSGDGVMRILKRLEAAGIHLRLPVGTDKLGRPVFAHKGITTTYQIPEFRAPAEAGPRSALSSGKPGPESGHGQLEDGTSVLPNAASPDCSVASAVPRPDQSPPIEVRSPDCGPGNVPPQPGPASGQSHKARTSVLPNAASPDCGPAFAVPRPGQSPPIEVRSPDQRPVKAAKPGPASGPSSSKEEENSSSSSSARRILRDAGVVLSDEEAADLIGFANRGQFKGPGWWRKLAANGDLDGFIGAWRATAQPIGDPGHGARASARNCAACGRRFTPETGNPDPCCTPCRNGEPTP